MALIHGDGSQANPWIVDNWADFQTYNVSANRSKYVQFASPHKNYETGVITLTGAGTRSNPYVVSSYEELLFATGARKTWECMLIDEENRLYVYKPTEDTEICCRYDSAPSTIDFNYIYTNGFTGDWYLESRNDFNGWTFLNMRMNNNQINSENTGNTHLKNIIMLNFSTSSVVPFRDFKFINSIFQGENSSNGSSACALWTFSGKGGIYNSAFTMKVRCGDSNATWNFAYTYQTDRLQIKDSVIDIDVEAYNIGQSDYSSNAICPDLTNTLIKGRMKVSGSYNSVIFWSANKCIFDFKDDSYNQGLKRPYDDCVSSVFNSDKVSWSNKTGLTGANTATINSPSALQAMGFPIYVDGGDE